MGMPPEDQNPAELFKKLVDYPRPSKVVDFPRNDPVSGKPLSKVRLMWLTQEETAEARADALKAVRGLIDRKELKPGDVSLETLQGIETETAAKEILRKAVRFPNPIRGSKESSPTGVQYPFVFHELSDFAEAQMSTDEIAVLYNQWEIFQHESGPIYTGPMGDEEVNAWVDRLAEGASEYPLSRISLPQLTALTSSLAQRVYTLGAVLASHSESLPSGLVSALEKWAIGTSFYGELPADAAMIGLVSSSGLNEAGEVIPRKVVAAPDLGSEPLTPEAALELAKKMGRGGIAGVIVGDAMQRDVDDG
jgi:hypothetical protein